MKKVLIVEDQEEIRELIRVTLEFEDYDISEAPNGDTGWLEIQRLRPDLVLMDVMMPGQLDGLAVCQRVKADPSLAATRVVMLTARGQLANQEEGRQAGADEYLVKPFSPAELLQVITRMLA
ncbi:response regulator transcription factor [Roseateles sp. BYS180W]|uniref:Response regulator transcription factor n=1 Tax=Roseateles rivi TaxID=3299028 RepID=A0ABW7FU98_9BURK